VWRQETAVTHPAGRWWSWGEKLPAPLRVPLRWRFTRFLVVGLMNTAFGYGVFAVLLLAGLQYALAAFLSTVAGVLFNFKSYGALVFGKHDNRLLLRFIAVYAVCYGINLVPLAWAERHGISLLVTGAVIALPMAAIAFLLNRRFVYSTRQ
jgi:putative flippase GtrA